MILTNKEKFIYLLPKKSLIALKTLNNDLLLRVSNLGSIIRFYKDQGYLITTATTLDQPSKINRFFLQYIVITYLLAQRIYINLNTNLVVSSLVEYYSSAIWFEREIYDLYGIYFESNSALQDLRRILTDYHFKGHPLRKDFALIGYTERRFVIASKTIRTSNTVIF